MTLTHILDRAFVHSGNAVEVDGKYWYCETDVAFGEEEEILLDAVVENSLVQSFYDVRWSVIVFTDQVHQELCEL